MKIKCPETEKTYLTTGKEYEIIDQVNEDLVYIIADHGGKIQVNIPASYHTTDMKPWERIP